ncbi:MAG: histidine phosphatase family protein [Candidatus Binatia bacterium]|nr:histidine phosphatase family protein [Candidatus Binatia bacterium]
MAAPVTIYLVRHGRPQAGFAEAMDPGLDAAGQEQAIALARELGPLGPLPLVTSPLRRARETALALETLWGISARVEPAVGEIPSPTTDLRTRGDWVRHILRQRWSDLPLEYRRWRDAVITFLCGLRASTVVTTHFVAINVAVGAATEDDRVLCCQPDYCSCTVLEHVNGTLRVVALGRQRPTLVL